MMPPAARPTSNAPTYESIVRDVRAGNFAPIYYLMGDESFYIDRLTELILSEALKPEERDFNLITFFGSDTTIDNVLNTAKGFPMGGKRLVVCVREAQNLKRIDRLAFYLRCPQPSTILLFAHKNGRLDKRLKVAALIEKEGVLFESKRLTYDRQLAVFVQTYAKEKKLSVDAEAVGLLCQYVGFDLSRMAHELDKLSIAPEAASGRVDANLVKRAIGMSREFSLYELQDALVAKDAYKTFAIAKYFEQNPKDNPIQKTIVSLFYFFSRLMQAYYAPNKGNERALAVWLGVPDFQVRRSIMPAMRNYTGRKVFDIIHRLRLIDARSKGIGDYGTPPAELTRELLAFILE